MFLYDNFVDHNGIIFLYNYVGQSGIKFLHKYVDRLKTSWCEGWLPDKTLAQQLTSSCASIFAS